MEFVEASTCQAFIPVCINSAILWRMRETIENQFKCISGLFNLLPYKLLKTLCFKYFLLCVVKKYRFCLLLRCYFKCLLIFLCSEI